MTISDTIDARHATTKPNSYHPMRRTGEKSALNQRGSADTALLDAPATTGGVSSSHYRRRVADDRATAASAAPATVGLLVAPPIVRVIPEILPNVDRATLDMRQRIFAAVGVEAGKRLPLSVTWPLLAGVSILLWVVIANLLLTL